jgi:uncharacterized protein
MSQKVAILGASAKPDRYANIAFKMLKKYGHTPLPVSPKLRELEGTPVYTSLREIETTVDTLTLYVGPDTSTLLQEQILKLKPKRVIFNPGSENPTLESALKKAGIDVIEACTLVMLKTNQFEKF